MAWIKGLITVIIPTWNRENDVLTAINSALQQSYKNIEVLVCDDGSTDSTHKLVSSIIDKRVRWIPGFHTGLPAAPRNIGLAAAHGEWIAFLDSDDVWHDNKLETQLIKLQSGKNSLLASCSNAERHIPSHPSAGPLLKYPISDTQITLAQLFQTNFIITSSVLFHRSLLENVVGFPVNKKLKIGEDYALWLRIATKTDFIFHSDPLLIYLDAPNTSIRADKRNEWIAKMLVLANYLHWLMKVSPLQCVRRALQIVSIEIIVTYKRIYWKIIGFISTYRKNIFKK